jgi:dynein assembly factor with WDR repeat domains 1
MRNIYLIFVKIFDPNISNRTDIDVVVNQICFEEPLISENKKPHLKKLIFSKFYFNLSFLLSYFHELLELIEKIESNDTSNFFLFKILRAHILPLTNCAFNKSGDKFITGSYDRTCKIWDTLSGEGTLS